MVAAMPGFAQLDITRQGPPKASIYRFFGEALNCLYVGQSSEPTLRWRREAADGEPWIDEMAHITIERVYATEADRIESELIYMLKPKYNIQHNAPEPEPPLHPDLLLMAELGMFGLGVSQE
jgi:excinuclease UvrABC nuclease subunit